MRDWFKLKRDVDDPRSRQRKLEEALMQAEIVPLKKTPEKSPEHIRVMPKPGDNVTLIKLEIKDGEVSRLPAGKGMTGHLMKAIQVGEQIVLNTAQTSTVNAIRSDDGRIFVDTQSSTYELFI